MDDPISLAALTAMLLIAFTAQDVEARGGGSQAGVPPRGGGFSV
jgi:hypothetical protein